LTLKQEFEFFDPAGTPWEPGPQAGTMQRVLSADPEDTDILTRLVRWAPGLDTTAAGVIRHGYVEEVYLLEGRLTDLTAGRTFTAGEYACRRPGMPHGPYRTATGCTMLEIRYRQ
jgi:hypothetical protein